MEKLGLMSALVWTFLGALALQGLRAPLTVIPAVVAPGRSRAEREAGRGGAGREAGRGGAAAEGNATPGRSRAEREAGCGGAGREAGLGVGGAAAEESSTTDTEAELRWGHERRARRWREAAVLQRRHHVASLAPEGDDCGYRPNELWTSAAEPHKHWGAIIREDGGRKKRGRVKAANPLYKGCSAATAINVDVDVVTVVLN